MKILIIKLSSIGDVIHTLPSLYAIRRAHPDAVVDWLVEEDASPIIKGHNLLNDCIVVRRKRWLKKPFSLDTWKDVSALIKTLRDKEYDIVIDFQGLIKSSVWAFLSRGKRRIGFRNKKELSGIFLNDVLPPYNPDIHAVDRYISLACYAGADADKIEFPICLSEDEKQRAYTILKENGVDAGEPFIVINPMARWRTKLWDKERFARLGSMIVERLGSKVVFTGSHSDLSEIEKICNLTNRKVINLAGATGIKELISVINLSKLLITVDSGPMHIAAAVGTSVVALFGPTAPWRTGPYGRGHIVIRKELLCSPCFSRRCKETTEFLCMKEIKAEDVMTAVEKKFKAGA